MLANRGWSFSNASSPKPVPLFSSFTQIRSSILGKLLIEEFVWEEEDEEYKVPLFDP